MDCGERDCEREKDKYRLKSATSRREMAYLAGRLQGGDEDGGAPQGGGRRQTEIAGGRQKSRETKRFVLTI